REKKLLSLDHARANRLPIDWTDYAPPKPELIGIREIAPPIGDLREYIDWSPFFHVWELRGRYPAIFDDETVGKQARELFDDAQKILDQIAVTKSLTAHGVFGFWAVEGRGDDVDLFADDSRGNKIATFHFLRQQMQKPAGQFNHCLADFVGAS